MKRHPNGWMHNLIIGEGADFVMLRHRIDCLFFIVHVDTLARTIGNKAPINQHDTRTYETKFIARLPQCNDGDVRVESKLGLSPLHI